MLLLVLEPPAAKGRGAYKYSLQAFRLTDASALTGRRLPDEALLPGIAMPITDRKPMR